MARLRFSRSFKILAASALLVGLWGVGVEPGLLQQRNLSLRSTQWTAQPLTIAVASDLHGGSPHAGPAMLERLVAGIQAAHPDLILLPGDFIIRGVVGGDPMPVEDIAAILGRLKAPLGVYATLGNHDWWHPGPSVRAALEHQGIRVLENEAIPLPVKAGTVPWLVGIGDDMTDHAQVSKAFAQLPADVPSIVMMHDPANAPELPPGPSVAFAGHTHGGQVRLPWIGALITPGRAPRRHAYGWIEAGPVPTYVTAGVGTSILPIRLNCPPEFVVLSLTP